MKMRHFSEAFSVSLYHLPVAFGDPGIGKEQGNGF
ncbi:MAG: hypothetical protein A4E65_00031 [Syntrophorhabdus sp. PtaU1.Bin153]|nr:MAG: hypothetical protein A4E65_00031 [Syntrophorhabdus sp. PtaU1.Bin153]